MAGSHQATFDQMDGAEARRRLDALDAVLFDLDGVLTHTESVHAAAWKQLFDAVLPKHEGQGDTSHSPCQKTT